jgi:uncharacterized glyoxalase superfamily protein PhnB
MQQVVPMIHVEDVRASVEWYKGIGFTVRGTNEPDGEMDWASLVLGNAEIMLTAGGSASADDRREVDLYIRTNDVDSLYDQLKGWVEVRIGLNNTFYGTREFIVRDLNGFWVTFGQELGSRQVGAQTGQESP